MKNKIIICLLVCILLVNVFVVYKVLKYYEGFSNSPLVYGARLYNVETCSCLTTDGKQFYFNQTGLFQKITYTSPYPFTNFTPPENITIP